MSGLIRDSGGIVNAGASTRSGSSSGREPLRDWLDEFLRQSGFARQLPYYAAVLARLEPIDDPGVAVMGVSAYGRRFYLHVNIDYFTRPIENARFLSGVLQHEVHHIVLGHLALPKYQQPAHPDLMELAMEMSANEHIIASLPGKPIRWNDYAAFGICGGQSTLERYELLVRARQNGEETPGGEFVDGQISALAARSRSQLDPTLADRVEQLVEEAVSSAAADSNSRLAGRTAGQWLEKLHGVEDDPHRYFDWKAALQAFLGWMRSPVHTYARPSRRFPSRVGEIPGRTYAKNAAEPTTLVVAIDTSSSMDAAELAEIGRHMRLLSDRIKLTVVECDTQIQRVYPFEGVLRNVAGRGGTDLRPVFDREFLRSLRAKGVIYFTDGGGPYPAIDPGIRTLWVLSKPWDFHCPWGVKARL